MAQLFPPYANTVARVVVFGFPLGLLVLGWAAHAALFSPYGTGVAVEAHQPVPFSHQHHVGELGMDCRYCHTEVETSATAGIPATEVCMTCHSQVWRDAPVLEPVRESWATGKRLRWQRVNDLPDYVYFDHSIHVQKGIACVNCHGRVDRMPLMAKAETLYMRWCLECHRAPEGYKSTPDEVFAMHASPQMKETSPAHGGKLEDCSICHR